MSETFDIKVENDNAHIKLLSILDMSAADDLLESLKVCVGKYQKLILDAGDVERVSTPCIQVLLAAASKMAEAGGHFSVKNVTPNFERGMRELGLSEHLKNWSES